MTRNLRNGLVAILFAGTVGCSGADEQSVGSVVEPLVAEAMTVHWQALQRGDWPAAYDRLHPDLKKSGLTLKRFTNLHAKRHADDGMPQDIRIAGAEPMGDGVIVSFDILFAPPGGGEPVVGSPRRRATLRKSGASWGLMTHDLLAVGPQGG